MLLKIIIQKCLKKFKKDFFSFFFNYFIDDLNKNFDQVQIFKKYLTVSNDYFNFDAGFNANRSLENKKN